MHPRPTVLSIVLLGLLALLLPSLLFKTEGAQSGSDYVPTDRNANRHIHGNCDTDSDADILYAVLPAVDYGLHPAPSATYTYDHTDTQYHPYTDEDIHIDANTNADAYDHTDTHQHVYTHADAYVDRRLPTSGILEWDGIFFVHGYLG